jgi:hypothetical protein
MIYNDEHIENLLRIEKEIIEPPAKDFSEERGHFKKNFILRSYDGKYLFRAFIRYNSKFTENFSIGLEYNPKEEKGSICLLRCNGSHGENNKLPHHSSFHIHNATAESINAGLRPESNIQKTEEYATLEQAVLYFLNYINLKQEDKLKYFPDKQLELFKNHE